MAPSTPIAACGLSGMNVRVHSAPPSLGGATSVVFGTGRRVTSPSPMSFPACRRSDCTRSRSPSSAASSSCGSYPVMPRSEAAATTTGMPLSTHVTSTPSITSTSRPVGSRPPVAEPAVSSNPSTTAAAVPGTPEMAVPPR